MLEASQTGKVTFSMRAQKNRLKTLFRCSRTVRQNLRRMGLVYGLGYPVFVVLLRFRNCTSMNLKLALIYPHVISDYVCLYSMRFLFSLNDFWS